MMTNRPGPEYADQSEKWQLRAELKEAQERIRQLEEEITALTEELAEATAIPLAWHFQQAD